MRTRKSRQNIFQNLLDVTTRIHKRVKNCWAKFQQLYLLIIKLGENENPERCLIFLDASFLEVSVNSGRCSWKFQRLGKAFVSLMGTEKILDWIMARKFPILKKTPSQILKQN